MAYPDKNEMPDLSRRAFINGQTVAFEPNDTILEAARRAGIFIPTLCELAALNHRPGTCRVCLVEVELPQGGREIVTSCETKIEPGMRIRTRTAEVRRRQKMQVELLMADHDENCSSCKRHGKCGLQDAALWTGADRLGLSGRYKPIRKLDMSAPAMRFDGGKCIRCLRCIEVCRQVQGVSALCLTGTGTKAEIGFTGAVNWGSSDRCIECGQCSLVCPTGAISVRDQGCDVFDLLDDDSITTVFQFAPALRVALSEEFGLPSGMDVQGKIVSALKRMGADYVMDTNWSADVTIMEEGTEMLANFERAKKAGTLHSKPFTYFTSCCPGWVNYVEKIAPDMIPHVSSTRSPQAIFGALAKTWLVEHAGIEKRDMRVISIMPCTAKKGEANRDTLKRADGSCDVDVVLTIREFARLIKRSGLNLADLPDMPFDSPMMSLSSGAGQLFGSTGGVMEAAVRTMSAVKNQDPRPMPPLTPVRGMEFIKEATVRLGDLGDIRIAVVHECANIAKVIEMVRNGTCLYHFVEVMACPGGCVGGGGTTRGVWGRNTAKRQQGIYAIDKVKKIRASYENPEVIRLYQEYLGSPGSERAHELLHCEYKPWKKRERKLTGPEILESVELSPE